MSDWSKIALLISDVDGTLVTHDKVLTPRTQEAVRRLDEAGIGFTITSSRPPRGLTKFIAPLALKLPIGGFNSGGLVNPADLSPVQDLLVSPAAARQALNIIFAHDMDAWVYDRNDWYVRDASAPHVAHETFTLSFPPMVVSNFDDKLGLVGKIVAVGDDPAVVSRCNAELDAALGGQASATRSQSFFIDITHPDANKGMMVETMARLLSIPTSAIATIGDMQNDLLMFRRAGLSIAMGNATDDVKAQAAVVTASNEEDGFAKAVEHFLLRRN
jgi:Cof subfamily protein (haloacid dehalogenase superfamily)